MTNSFPNIISFLFLNIVLLLGLALPSPTQAAVLTETQIQAIISLVVSFGADTSTANNVEAALRGQTTTDSSGDTGTAGGGLNCLDLRSNLNIGRDDSATNGEVSKLQRFLIAEGVYPEARVTGYYGLLTAQAVVRWQKAHGLGFVTTSTGVGPMTRERMKVCGTWGVETGTQTSSSPSITIISPNGGEQFRVGETYTIRWRASGIPSDAGIIFTVGAGSGYVTVSPGVLSDLNGEHSFQWTVPADYAMGDVVTRYPLTPGSNYRINASIYTPKNACRFLCRSDEPRPSAVVGDESDSAFTITQ